MQTIYKLAAAALLSVPFLSSVYSTQCDGLEPMSPLAFDVTSSYATASRICCHNHHMAERFGFHEERLWDNVNPDERTVYYDSVCGKPLFVAPIGRTFEKFKADSFDHGWPSFRPEETVAANVQVHWGGRMSSKCGTHLGHNLPNFSRIGPRYCIDLVCIAGLTMNSTFTLSDGRIVADHVPFDKNNFESLEWKLLEQGSVLPDWFMYLSTAIVVGAIYMICSKKMKKNKKTIKKNRKAVARDGERADRGLIESGTTSRISN